MDDPIFAAGGGGEGGSTFDFQCCGSFLHKVSVNEALYHLMVLRQNHLTPQQYYEQFTNMLKRIQFKPAWNFFQVSADIFVLVLVP